MSDRLEIKHLLKHRLLILCVALMTSSLNAQLTVNALALDVKYMGFSFNDPNPQIPEHVERSYISKLSYTLDKRWSFYAQGTVIRSTLLESPENLATAYIIGSGAEWDLIAHNQNRLYVRTALAYGNYCTCGDGLPYARSGLTYILYGLGLDWTLFSPVMVSIGFDANSILSSEEEKYNYNIPYVGLRIDPFLVLGKSKR